ncbi:MAG: sulfatase-like hydrolase/transferase [Gemmatimonadetes bacterium]|nr:sulfatase-like hydrolase/transferase [Gemmatimonadota bacterium]
MSSPNIILMMCDDLGYGDVGFNGNEIIKTPNLDRLASNGIRFTRFYAGGPVCSPTRGTCLTGRHYFRYGVTHANRGHLPTQEITLARMLKSFGYATGHFGKWHLGTLDPNYSGKPNRNPARNYAPPWERDYDATFATEYAVPTWDPAVDINQRTGKRLDRPWASPYYENGKLATENLEGCDSRVLMDRAIPFIEQAVENGEQFLTTIWFHAPHSPVVAGPEYRAMYAEYSEDEQHYYGCITAIDDQVGRLYHALEAWGVADNTMIWFCSDNGPEGRTGRDGRNRGSTAGLRGRKRSLFDGGVGVPALLHWPGHAEPGRTVEMPCSTLDYFPTIAEVMGYEMPDNRPIDGISLIPTIEGNMTERPTPIPYRFNSPKNAMFDAPTIAMIDNQYKCLTNLSNDGSEDLCFDMIEDRAETTNLANEQRERMGQTRETLRQWLRSCEASHNGGDYDEAFEPVAPFEKVTGDWPSRGNRN